MATLTGIEIFRPGIWNGMTFSDADMVEMVNNSNRCRREFQALLSLNHEEVAPSVIREAAFGVAVRYYLKRLSNGVRAVFADFENVPQELATLIHRFYPNRSIDLFESFRASSGEVLRNVIAGVSFLGSKMPPAVKGMFPSFALSFQLTPALAERQRGFRTFALEVTPLMSTKKKKYAEDAAGAPFDLGKALAAKRAELGKTEADMAAAVNESGDPQITEQTILDIESGVVMPSPALAERLAAAYGIEIPKPAAPAAEQPPAESEEMAQTADPAAQQAAFRDMLVEEFGKFRDALKAGQTPPAPAAKADAADVRGQMQTMFREMLTPVQSQVADLVAQRDAEREQRERAEIAHFLNQLETVHRAGKALCGEPVKAVLMQMDNSKKMKFADGQPDTTARQAFMDVLTTIAKSGSHVVPTGQISDPAAAKFKDDTTAKVEAFQREHHISTYGAALKQYVRVNGGI